MVRFTGLMMHPNQLSNVLASVAVLALWFATRPPELISRGRRMLLLLAFVYLSAAIFLTFSRSGWLSLGLMSAAVPLLRWPKISPVYIGSMAGVAGLMWATGLAEEIYQIVLGFNKSSAEFRGNIDLIATQAFASDPWTGIGVGGVVDYFNAYQLPVHDTYLQVASELGIFGIVVIGGMVLALAMRLAMVLFNGRHPLDREWAIGLLLCAGITAIQSQFAMFLWMKFIWALFALMECTVQISNRQHGDVEPDDLAVLRPRTLPEGAPA
jgi:O-antigen ligase